MPIVSVLGFTLVAVNPVFAVLAVVQVLRRSIGYGLTKPTNDMLYAVVSARERYKAKNFIDTAVYRGADVITAFSARAIGGLAGLPGVAMVCVSLAIAWTSLAFWVGRQYRERDAASRPAET